MPQLLLDYEAEVLYDESGYTYDGFLPPIVATYITHVRSQQSSSGTYVIKVHPREIMYRAVPHNIPG